MKNILKNLFRETNPRKYDVSEWRSLPSIENRFEVNVEGRLRRCDDKSYVKVTGNDLYKIKYRDDKGTHLLQRRASQLLDEVFPCWWVRMLDAESEYSQIKNFPDYYVTSCGNIYSTLSADWVVAHCIGKGMCQINIYGNGKIHSQYLHNIVGSHFLKDYDDEKDYVLIKDKTLLYPLVNHVNNLYVGSFDDYIRSKMGEESQRKTLLTNRMRRYRCRDK